jgi:hypothetical protein
VKVKKNGRPAGRPFFVSETFNTAKKVFAQCTGLGNPCTGKEPYTGRTEGILVEVAKYVRAAKMKFIDIIFNKMSTQIQSRSELQTHQLEHTS